MKLPMIALFFSSMLYASDADTNTANTVNNADNSTQKIEPVKQKTEETMTEATKKTYSTPEEFLRSNAQKEGVVSLNSDLQYKVLESGDGPKPNMHSSVTVHYEGKFLDGKVFDSSYARNEPAIFNLDQVIQGWTEALPHMNTGSTWEVYIGPKLAYGDRGLPGIIPPNTALVFKIQLVKVNS